MIAKLIFKLPDDEGDFELARNGWRYKSVIEEMYNWLRQLTKYQDKDTVTVEEVREKLAELEKDAME